MHSAYEPLETSVGSYWRSIPGTGCPPGTGGTGCHARREVVSDKMLLTEVLPLDMEPIKSFLDLASKLCVDLLL